MALGSLAGLRLGEALAIPWFDIDLTGRVLHIRNSATFTTKNGQQRSVPICSELSQILARYRPAPHRPGIANTAQADLDADYGYVVAPSRPAVAPGAYRMDFRRSLASTIARAEAPPLPFHGLRHCFATIALQAGVSVFKLAKWMGHQSSDITEIYGHLIVDGFDEDARRLGA